MLTPRNAAGGRAELAGKASHHALVLRVVGPGQFHRALRSVAVAAQVGVGKVREEAHPAPDAARKWVHLLGGLATPEDDRGDR